MSKGKDKDLEDKTILLMEKMWSLNQTFSRRKIESRRNIEYAFGEVPGVRNMEFPADPRINKLLEDAYQALIRVADARVKEGYDACQEHAREFRRHITRARDLYDERDNDSDEHGKGDGSLQDDSADPS